MGTALMLKIAKTDSNKKQVFGHLRKSQQVKLAMSYLKSTTRHIESDLHAIFNGNIVFTVFPCKIQNHIVSVSKK